MNRTAVASIAIACMVVAVAVAFSDPTKGGQAAAFAIGMTAAIVLCIGIISETGGSWGSSRGDTSQSTNIYIDGSPRHPSGHEVQPAYYAQPAPAPAPVQPTVIMVPMPGYPPVGYGHAPQPGYLQAPQHGGYIAPPPMHPSLQHQPQAQYRGAIDVVAEPVRHPQPQGQIRHREAPRLESPEAGLIRRLARKVVG